MMKKTNSNGQPMKSKKRRCITLQGYTVIELLIAVIIIGILVAIIVPRLATRSEQARKKAALADMENIQKSLETAAIDTSYYYRLHVLDDTRGGDDIGFNSPPNPANPDITDGIRDEDINGYYQNPVQIFIDIETGELKDPFEASRLYDLLARNETNFGWNGPYLTWNRDQVNWEGNPYPDDTPDDPWGNNYLFFTREGLMQEPDGVINETNYLGADTLVFDRFTLLSLGPNGSPGPDDSGIPRFGAGDDVYRQF